MNDAVVVAGDRGGNVCSLTALEQGRLVRAREISCWELLQAHLQHIDEIESSLHTFVAVFAEEAGLRARRLDRESRRDGFRGPLHGVPYALKDLIGRREHSQSTKAAPAADVTRKLNRAGLVLLGKTATYELGMGPPAESDPVPPAQNPWSLQHIPGGSSSGSASAVAAHLCPVALGTDTGGSVRHPAAYCGVVGFKPSFGRISLEGVAVLSPSLDHVGILARSVDDVALTYECTTSSRLRSRVAPLSSAPNPGSRPLEGVSVGVPWDFIGRGSPADDTLATFRQALRILADLGAAISDTQLPIERHEDVLSVILLSEAAARHAEAYAVNPEWYGLSFRARLAPGFLFSAVDYLQAQIARRMIRSLVDELVRRHDVLVLPTMPTSAPSWAKFREMGWDLTPPPFTSIFSLTGHPALSVPVALSTEGLPLALQLVARRGGDDAVLAVGRAFEAAAGFRGFRGWPEAQAGGWTAAPAGTG